MGKSDTYDFASSDGDEDEIMRVEMKQNRRHGRQRAINRINDDDDDHDDHDNTKSRQNEENNSCQDEIDYDEDDDDESISTDGSFFSSKTFQTSCTQNGDDITITSVTSGVVTVTIKECVTPDGFFKNRGEN